MIAVTAGGGGGTKIIKLEPTRIIKTTKIRKLEPTRIIKPTKIIKLEATYWHPNVFTFIK